MSLEVAHKLLIYGAESLSIMMDDHSRSVYSWTLTRRMAGERKCDDDGMTVAATLPL